MKTLIECRDAIDAIDSEILNLLKRRKDVAINIAKIKLSNNQSILDKKRESEKINTLMQKAIDLDISPILISDMYKTIMAHTVATEQSYIIDKINDKEFVRDTSVAFLGTLGSYSHLAAQKFLDSYAGNITKKGVNSFQEIVDLVENHICEFGVLPIENTSSGSINEVLDVLSHTKAHIVGELQYPIDHSILSTESKIDFSEIKEIYSHPQPILQCSQFIKEHLSHAKIIYTKASSEAMEIVSKKKDKSCVAIASLNAGVFYNLNPVASYIANNKNNFTRFILLSMTYINVPEFIDAKTSIIFTTNKYTPGSLIAVLNEFSKNNINLTKLHSRPFENPNSNVWEEIFFADIQSNLQSTVMQNIITNIKNHTGFLKILGCYPSYNQ